jgi:primosomal protein N' (replication factor Y)
VAAPRRLRLKAELIARPEVLASVEPFARIWVDSGIFHLDSPFDYSVPQSLSAKTQVGVRVQVPFNGREVEAIVLERLSSTQTSGAIKEISKVLSVHPVATNTTLQLIKDVSIHWACNPLDIVRSAIPPRVASIDKLFQSHEITQKQSKRSIGPDCFVAFEPAEDPVDQCVDAILGNTEHGTVLVIAPDEHDVDALCQRLQEMKLQYIRLDSSLSRSERYHNFLMILDCSDTIVVGARSAVFAPIRNLACVIMYKESSYDHYEKRTPGWNVRDVITLRCKLEDFRRIYMGYVPSLDISLLIERKEIKYISHSHQLPVKTFSSGEGALLPGRIFQDIRKALVKGPVLFLVPRRGYGNALLCANCKNAAICSCGSRLAVTSKGGVPICSICSTTYPDWSCSWCQSKKQYLASRGIDRAGEEISRAFPGYPLFLSFGDVIKKDVENRPALVLATPGSAPKVRGGYAAVVILEGLKFFAHTDLRSQERARELFFEVAAMARFQGAILLSIDEGHPITSSIVRWSPGAMIRRELTERSEIGLPPFVASVVLVADAKEITVIADGFRKAVTEGRLPNEVRIFGPSAEGEGKAKIVIYIPRDRRAEVALFVHELARRRSIAKKAFLTIKFDSYSL